MWGNECLPDDSATVTVPVFEWVRCLMWSIRLCNSLRDVSPYKVTWLHRLVIVNWTLKEQTTVHFLITIQIFSLNKCIWKYRLRNGGYFLRGDELIKWRHGRSLTSHCWIECCFAPMHRKETLLLNLNKEFKYILSKVCIWIRHCYFPLLISLVGCQLDEPYGFPGDHKPDATML